MYVIMGGPSSEARHGEGPPRGAGEIRKAHQGHRGLISAFIWNDDQTGAIIGIALWDTKADYEAARHG